MVPVRMTVGTTTTFQYDGSDILRDSTATYLHGPGVDDVLSRTIASGNEYFLKDHLGSTIALTDPSGTITNQYTYSAYGKVTKTGNSGNYFTYTGHEDDGTGLYFYRARYYSPDLKRFVAEDPIGFGGGQSNLYGYVGGNPVSLNDPSGLASPMLTELIKLACKNKKTGACNKYPEAPGYAQAYANAEAEFYSVVDLSTVKISPNSKFGFIETGELVDGGSATFRPAGSSGLFPTINLSKNRKDGSVHNTPGYRGVDELKFKYTGNQANYCPLPKLAPSPSSNPSIPLPFIPIPSPGIPPIPFPEPLPIPFPIP